MKRPVLFLFLILFLVLTPSGVALAQSGTTVISADEAAGDVVLFDGNLVIEAGATVRGDVAIFTGDATIAGTVTGDVVLFNGNLQAEETAVINGECAVFSGNVTDHTAAGLSCTNFGNWTPSLNSLLDKLPAVPPVPPPPVAPPLPAFEVERPSGAGRFFGSVAGAVFRTLLLAGAAFVVASLFPQHLGQVVSTARQKPAASGAVGFLTAMAVPILMLLLSPVLAVLALVCGLGLLLALALVLLFTAALALGWFAAGHMLGRRIVRWLNLQNPTLPLTTAVGTAALTLGFALLSTIPFVIGESIVAFFILCIGLGAVALTKFGSRPYPMLDDGIRILTPEHSKKVTAVLQTLPDDDIPLK